MKNDALNGPEYVAFTMPCTPTQLREILRVMANRKLVRQVKLAIGATAAHVAVIAKQLPNITFLDLTHGNFVAGQLCNELVKFKQLEVLILRDAMRTLVGTTDLRDIIEACAPTLRSIDVSCITEHCEVVEELHTLFDDLEIVNEDYQVDVVDVQGDHAKRTLPNWDWVKTSGVQFEQEHP